VQLEDEFIGQLFHRAGCKAGGDGARCYFDQSHCDGGFGLCLTRLLSSSQRTAAALWRALLLPGSQRGSFSSILNVAFQQVSPCHPAPHGKLPFAAGVFNLGDGHLASGSLLDSELNAGVGVDNWLSRPQCFQDLSHIEPAVVAAVDVNRTISADMSHLDRIDGVHH